MTISEEHRNNVCKIGQGNICCRYLGMHPGEGFICLKLTNYKEFIDKKVTAETMTARGDNCDGID